MIILSGSGTVTGGPSAGEIAFLTSADIEPVNGSSANKWTSSSGATPTTSTTPTGVHDHAWNTTGGGSVLFTLPTATLTPSAGMRVYVTSDTSAMIIRFTDGSTGEHLEVQYVAGNNFRVARDISTVLATSTGGHFALNTQLRIEITGVVDDTTGSFTCNLYDDSGTLLETISASGVDTRDGGGQVTAVLFKNLGYWEDAWCCVDGELYQPCEVETLSINGDGDLTDLVRGGTDSGADFSQVNEKPVQIGGAGDDYLDSTASDQISTFTFADRALAGTPRALGIAAACQGISGGPTFKLLLRIAGVNYEGTQTFTTSGANKIYVEYWNNNPATGNAWTDADINSAQVGIKWIDTNGRTRGIYPEVLVQV